MNGARVGERGGGGGGDPAGEQEITLHFAVQNTYLIRQLTFFVQKIKAADKMS